LEGIYDSIAKKKMPLGELSVDAVLAWADGKL
jgi:hypothetical protein